MAELLLQPVGADTPGHCGGLRRRLDALHEGGVLLDEGRVHFGWVGPSCSTHNPWPVDPDPRGAGRLTPTLGGAGVQPRPRDPAQTSDRERCRRTCDGGAGLCGKSPGLTLSGPVSTALTLTGPTPKYPTGIVGILRFLSGERRRGTRDVSTMDTSDPPDLFPPRIVTSRTTSPPKVPARASASEVMTPTCLRSEKAAQ